MENQVALAQIFSMNFRTQSRGEKKHCDIHDALSQKKRKDEKVVGSDGTQALSKPKIDFAFKKIIFLIYCARSIERSDACGLL